MAKKREAKVYVLLVQFIIIIYLLEFFTTTLADGLSQEFEWEQVSRILLSILAVLNNALIWILSTHPLDSKSSNPFNDPLITVPKVPITIGNIVTFMFHSCFFFNFLARPRYLFFLSHSLSFIRWSTRTAKSIILQILFFFYLVDYY